MRTLLGGGVFLKDKYMDTHRMYVADCMMHTDCNAVNYRSDKLHCQLLTETNRVNQLLISQGSYYSQMKSWRKVNQR